MTQPPSRLQRIREIYEAVVELDGDSRLERLAELCDGDADLQAEIEELLALERHTVLDRLDSLTDSLHERAQPEHIGPYEILGVLGRGGMGVVYRARQSEPIEREVALKLIHLRASDELIKRFHAERQLLARMSNVHIAKVFDAGSTEEGEPYLAMELIEGREIDLYCDEQKLSTRDRLRLVIDACQGVQHAHQKGIIHRDLKPSNLLVTDTKKGPLLRIIDFGIARIESELEEARTLLTQQGQVLGTPEYMSPEQAEGDIAHIDARSDVYSLGVVLYRLLSGRLPYDLKGTTLNERARIIATTPAAPLTAKSGERALDPDLGTIVRKALEKDPELRYASVGELSADLERFLDGLPITARPPSTMYQLRKLVRRHRLATALASLVLLLLVGFGLGMTVLAESQRRALAEAELERNRATRVREFLQDMLASADPAQSGRDVTVREVLGIAGNRAEQELQDDPEILSAIHRTLGATYRGLGELDQSADHLLAALTELDSSGTGSPGESFDLHLDLAQTHMLHGEFGAAHEQVRLAEASAVSTTRADELRARCLTLEARIRWHEGAWDVAESLATASLELHEIAGSSQTEAATEALHALAVSQLEQYKLREARQVYEELIERRTKILGETHPDVYAAKSDLAMILQKQGEWAECLELGREIRDHYRELYGTDHFEYAAACNNLASHRMMAGLQLDEAATDMEAALTIWERSLNADHPYLVSAHNNLGFIRHLQLRFEEASAHYRRALSIQPGHATSAIPTWNLAWTHLSRHEPRAALELLDAAVEEFPNALLLSVAQGYALMDLGRSGEAARVLETVNDTFVERDNNLHLNWALAQNALARCGSTSSGLRDSLLAESEDFLFHGERGLEGSWIPWRIFALEKTAAYFLELGDAARAEPYTAKAEELRRRAASASEG